MSIITFTNIDKKETGQTLSAAAIAACMSIEHNYKTLLISTDFNDRTMENCFYNIYKKNTFNPFTNRGNNVDIANGLEGLVRTFASNRASSDLIKSYTRPILNDRLDLLAGPKTADFKDYATISTYFSQIAEVANQAYDIVLVDLNQSIPRENQDKLIAVSSLVVVGLTQTQDSINGFLELKEKNEFYRKNNVILLVGRYNQESRYTAKNISRYLNEKELPIVVPYNILLSDYCNDGKIIDYLLSIQKLSFNDGRDGYFYNELKKSAETIDFTRKQIDYGIV